MKKMITILAVLLFTFVATSAFAGSGSCTDSAACTGASSGVMAQYRTSTNVTLQFNAVVSSYAATAAHLNGDRAFGSSSGDSQIFYQAKTAGTAWSSTLTNSDSQEFQSGWTAL